MLLGTMSRQRGEMSGLRKYCLIIVSLVVVSIQLQAQNGWTQITDLPTPRLGATASVVNGNIYVLGGSVAGLADVATNEMYDPSTDTWDTLAPMPTPRGFLTSEVVNGIIYAIGGGYPFPTTKNEAYDPVSNSWTTKADLPGDPRLGMRAAAVNGIIYVLGGNYDQRDCYAYDHLTDTWDTVASIPVGGGGALSATVHNGLIYTFGGSTYPPWSPLPNAYAYDPQTNTWDAGLTPLSIPRFELQTYLVNDIIYAIGGSQSQGTSLAIVERYDPVTNTLGQSLPEMPNPLSFFAGAAVESLIYVIGGTADWTNISKDVWEYAPVITEVKSSSALPGYFLLEQNYPNPFNPSTTVRYGLLHSSFVTLTVRNMLGQQVAELVNEQQPAGYHDVTFHGDGLASGVYFCLLQAGDFVATKKLLLLR